MLPVLKYTVLRLALFVAALLLLWLAGARSALALALAVIVSMLLSFVLLRQQRDELFALVTRRLNRNAATSDEAIEDARLEQSDPPNPS